jgi:hypothetical protein
MYNALHCNLQPQPQSKITTVRSVPTAAHSTVVTVRSVPTAAHSKVVTVRSVPTAVLYSICIISQSCYSLQLFVYGCDFEKSMHYWFV